MSFKKNLFTLLFFFFTTSLFAIPGSASFMMSQRFFSDEKLGERNGFSEWGSFQFGAEFGLYRLPFNIEPLVGINYIQGSASAYAVDSNGNRIQNANGEFLISSIDKLSYKFISSSLGFRWKAWRPTFFRLVPYIQIMEDFRWGTLEKTTYALSQTRSIKGFDMGTRLGAGFLISFIGASSGSSDLQTEWNIKDFGFVTFVNYLSGGQIKSGFGDLESLAGWDFGAGLHMAW